MINNKITISIASLSTDFGPSGLRGGILFKNEKGWKVPEILTFLGVNKVFVFPDKYPVRQ